jgi:hypothetical protein
MKTLRKPGRDPKLRKKLRLVSPLPTTVKLFWLNASQFGFLARHSTTLHFCGLRPRDITCQQ